MPHIFKAAICFLMLIMRRTINVNAVISTAVSICTSFYMYIFRTHCQPDICFTWSVTHPDEDVAEHCVHYVNSVANTGEVDALARCSLTM